MNSDIRIGVIGTGGRGGLAAYAHRPQDGVRLVAGADIRPAALDDFRSKYGNVFVTDDYRKILERSDVDAVFVTTPDYWHEEMAVAALEAGKAVYLEKPMAITVEGCDRILRTAVRNNVKLYLGHNMRHFAVVLKMRELIQSGAIGEVKGAWCRHFISYGGDAYFKDWHAESAKSTGLLLQKGAHDIDVLHWLCGGYSRRVTALGGLTVYNRTGDRNPPDDYASAAFTLQWPPLSQTKMSPLMNVEDLSMMLMELDNGVFASYQHCHFSPDAWRNYTIIGTEGRIENFGDTPGEAEVCLWNRRTNGFRPLADVRFVLPLETGTHGGADAKIVAEFIDHLRGGKATTSPVAARYSVAAGYTATMSIREGGKAMDVPVLAGDLAAKFDRGLE